MGAYELFRCDTTGCEQQGPEFCTGCVIEGLSGESHDCRFEGDVEALAYLDHCDSCSCIDQDRRVHSEGFVACPTHRAAHNAEERAHG